MYLSNVNKDTVDRYVQICCEAVEKIKDAEIRQKAESKIYERNFVITFAFHLGQLLCSIYNKEMFAEALYNGELYKKIDTDDIIKEIMSSCFQEKKIDNNNAFTFIPDFVIHTNHNPGDLDISKQHLIIEAKTDPNLKQESFNWDLFKLIVSCEKLNFRNAIYLISDVDLGIIGQYINNYYSIINYFYGDRDNKHLYFLIRKPKQTGFELYELKHCAQISR